MSNVTLQGPLGGEGIELTCQVWEGSEIEWSIDNRTVSTYEVEDTTLEKAPFHLHSSLPGVATAIVMVTPSSSHPGLFYIGSTLISDVRTLGPLFSVECISDAGRGQVVANLSSGNVNSSSGLVVVKPSVKLTSNATSLHGDECGEIIQFICQINEELYVDWMFGVKEIAHYGYDKSDEDRCPFKVKLEDSSFSSLNVSITKIKKQRFSSNVDLTSTLTINVDELVSHNIHTISCRGKDSLDSVTIDLQHNCTIPETPLSPAAHVTLSSNDTTGLQGNICPGGVEMTCATYNVPYMTWYFNNTDHQVVMATYSFTEGQQFPVNLCDSAKGNGALDEFCNNSGSINIDVATQGEGEGVYNFNSTLVARESYIRKQDFQNVQCGSDKSRDTILTNFTVSCKIFLEPKVTLIFNGTSDSHVELMCHGQDISSLWWTYNNNTESITALYHFSPTSPQRIPSLVPHVEVTMVTADEDDDDLDNNINCLSMLSFNCNNVRDMRSIECGSEDIREQVIINCK